MLSQRTLSEFTKIPQTALSRFEAGLASPSKEDIGTLAKYLEFPEKFFCNNNKIYPPATPFHRKKISISKKIVESAEALGNIQRIQINNMLSQLDPLSIDIPFMPIDEDDQVVSTPVRIAQYTRRSFGLPKGPIDNMTKLLEDHGAFISFVKFETPKIDGFTLRGGLGEHPMIFLNDIFQGEKDRMTLAHELGHIVMHQMPSETCEEEAWAFASEFLMPADEIVRVLPRRLTNIKQLVSIKQEWKVSMKALVKRSSDLGVIDMRTARYLYSQLAPYGIQEPLPVRKEKPLFIQALIDFYEKDLAYSEDDLLSFLWIEKDMFDEWYGKNKVKPKFTFAK
jgi:Zn-dependent peptidase ImmA (M78 family)/transcriptional regulator with XRE-family HTH domain